MAKCTRQDPIPYLTLDASLACRQVGPIRMVDEPKDGEKVFSKSRSLIFKTLQVVRFFDKKRQTYIYLAYSDRGLATKCRLHRADPILAKSVRGLEIIVLWFPTDLSIKTLAPTKH